jgi:hypothetical protein
MWVTALRVVCTLVTIVTTYHSPSLSLHRSSTPSYSLPSACDVGDSPESSVCPCCCQTRINRHHTQSLHTPTSSLYIGHTSSPLTYYSSPLATYHSVIICLCHLPPLSLPTETPLSRLSSPLATHSSSLTTTHHSPIIITHFLFHRSPSIATLSWPFAEHCTTSLRQCFAATPSSRHPHPNSHPLLTLLLQALTLQMA